MGSTTVLPRRILIVEDNRVVARDLEARLIRLGFAIAGAVATGEHALELAASERPDLALMDIRLAGEMTGIIAADQLRARHDLPVVFLTAHGDEATLRAASVTEPFGYILKPAEDRELSIVIEMALYKHAAEHERRSLERQLRRSEKLDAIGQLAGGIAHDFNNVLLAILSHCRTLMSELPTGERPHHQAQLIRTAAERAAGMTRQLLAFGRDDHDQPIALDLAAHIHRISAMLVQLLSDNISVVISLAPGLRAVLGRSSEIEQVIMNLVVNARDAMPRGGTITIAARNVPETDEVLLTVTDTGEGIDEATRRRMFEPFFTTKPIGAGTGLGLATVYAVVARAHGRLDVTSEPGKGATFSIWLPATQQVPAEPAPPLIERVDLGPAPDPDAPLPTLHGTVVVVEDDEQVRDAIAEILKEAGLDVIVACDGAEALEACRAHARPVDLVLSDVVMPRLGGAELARSLALDAPTTKILYMSGYPHRGLLGAGARALGRVLQKPFTPSQLLSLIREALAA